MKILYILTISCNDEYIVGFSGGRFEQNSDNVETRMARRGNSDDFVLRKFESLNSLSASLNKDDLDYIKSIENVQHVEKGQTYRSNYVQKNAPYGLAMIPQTYYDGNLEGDYTYGDFQGQNTKIYVVDTGININHSEFEKRASFGFKADPKSSNVDENGHGTHVAAISAGKTYGVAKKGNLVAVKVLNDNGEGSTSNVIAGLDWVISDIESKKTQENNKSIGFVVNMSLGGNFSRSINTAVERLSKKATVVVASGNENQDSCKTSPGSAPSAITVSANDNLYLSATFSNYGRCVDTYAPGVKIKSAWNTGTNSFQTLSGTSMASPHVAGVAAVILSAKNKLGIKNVTDYILKHGLKGKIRNIPPRTPNLFVHLDPIY